MKRPHRFSQVACQARPGSGVRPQRRRKPLKMLINQDRGERGARPGRHDRTGVTRRIAVPAAMNS